MIIDSAFEGDTDLPVVRKLLQHAGFDPSEGVDCSGKDRLDELIDGLNTAARGSPWFVLRDLDRDADCAPTWLTTRKFARSRWMCLRLAVRQTESWLMADASAFAEFFSVRRSELPEHPDDEPDAKESVVALSRRSARASIRSGMVPSHGDTRRVGPLYETLVIEFGIRHWDLDRAVRRSPSLRSARKALHKLARDWARHSGT